MTVEDKVCEQVSLTMLSEMYPQAVIERCGSRVNRGVPKYGACG